MNYQDEVRKVYSWAVCYQMSYMRTFYFVVYDSISKRHYEKSEAKAWQSAYQNLVKQGKIITSK